MSGNPENMSGDPDESEVCDSVMQLLGTKMRMIRSNDFVPFENILSFENQHRSTRFQLDESEFTVLL